MASNATFELQEVGLVQEYHSGNFQPLLAARSPRLERPKRQQMA